MEQNAYMFKIIFAGDCSTGKSSIFTRYNLGSFPKDPFATVGVDFWKKVERVDEKDVVLQIWDQAGAERYRSWLKNYTNLKFDLTNNA